MNGISKKLLFATILGLNYLTSIGTANAQGGTGYYTQIGGHNIWNPVSGFQSFMSAFGKANTVLNTFTAFASLACVAMLVWSGYTFITANGSSENVEKAQKMAQGAAVGLGVVLIGRTTIEFLIGPGVLNI